MIINPFNKYAPMDLYSDIMQLESGDTNQLCNAMLALCVLVSDQQEKIRKLEQRIDVMRTQIPPVNAVSQKRIGD